MNIATAMNKRYVPYAGVMLYSIASHNSQHMDAYILHSELEETDIDYLRKCTKSFNVNILPLKVDRSLFDIGIPTTEQWSLETYYRLLLLDILPADVERILYLDVDMVVNQPLNELYETELEGVDLVACENACGKTTPDYYYPKQREMFAPMFESGYRYFCAGMLLLHIERLRKTYSFQSYLDAMAEWDYQMHAPDQDILNYVHWRHVKYVDPYRYNLFARMAHNEGLTHDEVKESCAILHYPGDKPWESTNVHYDLERIWWEYAKETPAYESLLEAFLTSSLRDYPVVENYILGLEKQNRELNESLTKAMALLKRVTV